MLNDRDDKYENHDETEYHFSDDEVNYEMEESEPPKTVVASEHKENILNRLTRSKRMLISIVVFLGLIFVVYKMVSPGTTSTTPSTDIITPAVVAQQNSSKIAPTHPAPAISTSPQPAATVATNQPASAMQHAMTAPQQGAAANSVMPASVPTANPVILNNVPAQPMMSNGSVPQQPAMAMQTVDQNMPSQQNNATMPAHANTAMTQSNQPPAQPMPMNNMPGAMPSPEMAQQTMPTTVTSMPALMPVQSVPANSVNQQAMMVNNNEMPASVPSTMPSTAAVDTTMLNAATESARLTSQLQAEYQQKVNDYAMQNKVLQEQLQTLNGRVASMENQMTQLIQALTQQQAQRAPNTSVMPAHPPVSANEPRIAYNVQAIIPGRAWLRSDSGETVTVAEGDVVKDLGRVTKIDPYDGVVEINTGTRLVSLSYGNGG